MTAGNAGASILGASSHGSRFVPAAVLRYLEWFGPTGTARRSILPKGPLPHRPLIDHPSPRPFTATPFNLQNNSFRASDIIGATIKLTAPRNVL